MPVKRAILIVGVEKYQDQMIQELRCVDNDRTKLDGFFSYRARYDDVRNLRGESSQEVLDTAAEMAQKLSPGDLFVFYFCGHGCQTGDRYLMLCSDARLKELLDPDLRRAVDLTTLKKKTTRNGVDRVFILDSCRSDLDDMGLPTSGNRSTVSSGFKGDVVLRDIVLTPHSAPGAATTDLVSSLAVLSSCSDGKQAAELRELGHGIFTAAMLELLADATDKGQALAVNDALRDTLVERMRSMAERYGMPAKQYPAFWAMEGPPPLILPGLPARVVVTPPADPIFDSKPVVPPEAAKVAVQSPAQVPVEKPGHPKPTEPIHIDPPRVMPPPIPVQQSRGGDRRSSSSIGSVSNSTSRKSASRPAPIHGPTEAYFPMTPEAAAGVQEAAAAALRVPVEVTVPLTEEVHVRFRLIPAGEFLMGSPPGEPGRRDDESSHSVKITKPFYMQATALTQAQWRGITGNYPVGFVAPERVVVENSFIEVNRFFAWPWAQRRGFRLPTEAEWEYACRAGSADPVHAPGNVDLIAWHAGNSGKQIQLPGQLKANPWGLHDMLGNVTEWCSDEYGAYPAYPVTDPIGSPRKSSSVFSAAGNLLSGGRKRVARGGWYGVPGPQCRAACRYPLPPEAKGLAVGVRIVWTFDKEILFGPLGILQ